MIFFFESYNKSTFYVWTFLWDEFIVAEKENKCKGLYWFVVEYWVVVQKQLKSTSNQYNAVLEIYVQKHFMNNCFERAHAESIIQLTQMSMKFRKYFIQSRLWLVLLFNLLQQNNVKLPAKCFSCQARNYVKSQRPGVIWRRRFIQKNICTKVKIEWRT